MGGYGTEISGDIVGDIKGYRLNMELMSGEKYLDDICRNSSRHPESISGNIRPSTSRRHPAQLGV